jgi:class 3 adenylate cyclase
MSTEIKKEIQLEIAYVLFIDIVGYSKLLIDEQGALLETLNQIVRSTEQFRNAEAAGKLIKIPTGDGMALVFQDRLEAPVECALEISRALKEHPTLALRMGVHSGPVSGVIDVNERANVAGAGIIMAQRVMDCGDAGHILLSKHVAEDLEQFARWKPLLHDLGECEVKHGARVQVVNLHTDDLGNPEPPEKFRHLRGKKRIGTAISGSTAARPNR